MNGKDITEGNYVSINDEKRTAEVPVTAIMEELGAEVTWQNDTKVIITYNGREIIIDMNEEDYGFLLPPDSRNCVRKKVGDDIIFDDNSATVYMLTWPEFSFKIDYENRTVTVAQRN